jgi:restriction endonuclease S subunit
MSSDPSLTLKIGEFAKVKGGKRMPSGTALTPQKTTHPYLRIVDFKDGTIDCSNLQYVPEGVFPQISRYVISSADLYISIVGTVGLVGTIPEHLDGANLTENAAKICEIDKARIDQRFLGYFLRSKLGQGAIKSLTVGSTQPKLALFRIEQIEVPCPSLDEQKQIASLLGALDDRINLLRETNTLLEQIAQTIFKSWFVDFDPVRAKQEGRQPEGIDEETAALFPDSFEESELGMVPRGWKVMAFLDACDLLGGAQPPASTFKNEPQDGYVRLLQIRDFSTDAHKTYVPDTAKLRKAKEDDILLGRYGSASGDKAKDSLGRVCRGLSGAYNVALMKLNPIEVRSEFALQLVNDPRFYGYLQGVSSKAVQSGFSKAELGQYKVVIPPKNVAIKTATVYRTREHPQSLITIGFRGTEPSHLLRPG